MSKRMVVSRTGRVIGSPTTHRHRRREVGQIRALCVRTSLVFLILPTALALGCDAPKRSDRNRSFTEHLIADNYFYAYGIAAADLDGDGDIDITSADARGYAMYWYENDGRGDFKRHSIAVDEAGWFERHAIGDIDRDGHLDVVVVKNRDGHIVWFENGGRPDDGDSWNRHVITTDCKRAYDVELVDLNDDGWLDVVASGYKGDTISWFMNPGSGSSGVAWQREIIDPELAEARTVRVADFNGDGKPDILATGFGADLIVWYEQTNRASHGWRRHVVDDQTPQPVHGEPADIDFDGDVDVVMALGMRAVNREPTPDTRQH